MFNSYTKCTNCDLTKHQKWYFATKIIPKEGVFESSIKNEYCEYCENHTMWFMGKGVPTIDEISFSFRQSTLKDEEKDLKLYEEEIRRIEKISNNFFDKLWNVLKLNLLKKKRNSIEKKIGEIKKELDNSINNSDSIKFCQKLKPTPRCLECGHNKLYKNPKHTCGGDIVFETDESISYNPSWIVNFVYEYDEYGNVTKKQIRSKNISDDVLDKMDWLMKN